VTEVFGGFSYFRGADSEMITTSSFILPFYAV
jgi:hypothetical protein